jgi:neutral trehalase
MRILSWAVFVSCMVMAGCGGPLADAQWLFDAGQYPRAKQVLASLEGASAAWDAPRRAEYALYRGLTLGALGDWDRASRWLDRARILEDGQPHTLSRLDALRLELALASRP